MLNFLKQKKKQFYERNILKLEKVANGLKIIFWRTQDSYPPKADGDSKSRGKKEVEEGEGKRKGLD